MDQTRVCYGVALCLTIAFANIAFCKSAYAQVKTPPKPPSIESMQRFASQRELTYLNQNELAQRPSKTLVRNQDSNSLVGPQIQNSNSAPSSLPEPNQQNSNLFTDPVFQEHQFDEPGSDPNQWPVGGQFEHGQIPNAGGPVSDSYVSEGTPVFVEDVWWSSQVNSQIGLAVESQTINLEQMIFMTMRQSPRILSISQTPLIRETEITYAQADFDPELFARTKYEDRTDPVGNILTTGTEPFLETKVWSGATGFRKKLAGGGSFDIEQRFGHENNNSQFFEPQDQGTATLSLNFTQPLLRGAGKSYNRSQILLAELGTGIAWDEFAEEIQSELLSAAEAYWNLYYQRALLIQKRQNVERGQAILARLEARSDFDSIPSQIARARAAIQQRRTELANAVRDVKNAETEIRRLTAYTDWQNAGNIELIPQDTVSGFHQQHDLQQVVTTALEYRPEIKEVMKRTQAAAIAADVSKSELLPELSLIFGAYASGLEGESNVGKAWAEQFSNTTPGFYSGLEFAIPYKNRAARSRHQQRRLQVVQIRHEVDRVVQEIVADAQIALRRVESAHQTAKWANEALLAAQQDLQQNEKRWESFGLVDGDLLSGLTAATALDQLLDAQQRLSIAELTYSQATVDYKIAEVSLKKATGTLMMEERISINRSHSRDLPSIELSR